MLLWFSRLIFFICQLTGIPHSGADPHLWKYPGLQKHVYSNKNKKYPERTHLFLPLYDGVYSFRNLCPHSCPDRLSTSAHPPDMDLRCAVTVTPVVSMHYTRAPEARPILSAPDYSCGAMDPPIIQNQVAGINRNDLILSRQLAFKIIKK